VYGSDAALYAFSSISHQINLASSQTSCLPFSKPKVRGILKRVPKAFEIISNCAGQMENVSEILWVILRSLSRDIENLFDRHLSHT
jgi:hypothetical protein